jgi:hypothetical protein
MPTSEQAGVAVLALALRFSEAAFLSLLSRFAKPWEYKK